jgi:GTP-binding protein Era
MQVDQSSTSGDNTRNSDAERSNGTESHQPESHQPESPQQTSDEAQADVRENELNALLAQDRAEISPNHKAGFVNIIGNPNVGKSTLTNALVGAKLSIITPKAQTTRHRIFGIVNEPDFQMIISDTPGVMDPQYKLQDHMMDFVWEVFEDADVLLYVVEGGATKLKAQGMEEKMQAAEAPLVIVVNKIDQMEQSQLEAVVAELSEAYPRAEIYPLSALNGFGVDELKRVLIDKLPASPPYFDKSQITDKTERFIVEEKIREKILNHYKKEIPYAVEVVVQSFKEEPNLLRIHAEIHVERDSQKGILIGHKGAGLKRVGSEARRDLERFFDRKIHLELFVKVQRNWRNSDVWLKRYGYKRK